MGKAKKSTKKAVQKTESQFYVVRTALETRTNLADVVGDYNEKYVRKPVKTGKEFFEGVEKDARKIIDDFLDSGKKSFNRFFLMETIEKKVNSGLKAVPSQLNLPSKKDIDKLSRSVKALNHKVENLSKQYAA